MKKNLFTAILMGAVSMVLLSGCAVCRKPLNDNCVTPGDHYLYQNTCPEASIGVKPVVLPSGDVFRPVFRADAKKVSVTGIGFSKCEARDKAVVNFLKDNNCDYIVSVTVTFEETVHPSWNIFKGFKSHTFTATVTGIPVKLDSLVRDKAPASLDIIDKPVPPACSVKK